VRAAAALGALALVLAARPAFAGDPPSEFEPQSFESPQYFAAQLKFGPYHPSIDSEFKNGAGPYKRFFGNSSGLLMDYEVDFQFFHRMGIAAAGLSVGYWTKSAKSFPCLNGATETGAACQADFTTHSGDSTSLSILPFSLLASYSFDWAANHYRIPLVPYVKLGLTYTLWWIEKGNGTVADYTASGTTQHGRGGQFGLRATFGLAIQLDAIDPAAGRELDGTLGINHTYVFWEWNWWGADGLGGSNPLHTGDSNWLAGLGFEF